MSSLSESGSTCRPKKNGSNDCRLCGNGGFNGGSSARFFAFSASRSRRFIFGSSAIATCSRRCRGRRPGATAASPRLLAKIASGQPLPVGRDLVVGMIHDFCRMCRLLGEEAQVQRRFHSVEALVKAHDALAARVLAKGCASDMQYEFPAPPVSGTEGIIPVTTVTELYDEAREQRNCVASFAVDVACGDLYIYRMLAPERATISLRREGRVWMLDQVAACRNAPVSESAYASVAVWLGIDMPF